MSNNCKLLWLLISLIIDTTLCQHGSITENKPKATINEVRTFGHHFLKRMSYAVVPGAFVVGVVATLLAALTVISMKGLGVGVILLVLTIGQMLSRALPVHATMTAFTAPAPLSVVYSPSHRQQQPVWLEKEW